MLHGDRAGLARAAAARNGRSRNDADGARGPTQTLTEIWETDRFTMATLSVAVRAIRTLVAASALPAIG